MKAMSPVVSTQPDLFAGAWPEGLRYQPEFLSVTEESALLQQFAALQFRQARYKSYDARRRVVSYGGSYDFEANVLRAAEPVPEFLLTLRARIAAELRVAAERLAHALISEYRPGTPLGWHRDVPEFDTIAGVSLLAPCEMRFRPYRAQECGRRPVVGLELARRSLYVIAGPARWRWQHSVVKTAALRYSITMRTTRRRLGDLAGSQ
jgi:alkylated DNA repair dioxygenase AlkB